MYSTQRSVAEACMLMRLCPVSSALTFTGMYRLLLHLPAVQSCAYWNPLGKVWVASKRQKRTCMRFFFCMRFCCLCHQSW